MKFSSAVFLLCLLGVSQAIQTCDQDFTSWRHTHGKVYSSIYEEAYRRQVFCKHLDTIRTHNARGNTWYMKMNAFGDRTPEEFFAQMVGTYAPLSPYDNQSSQLESNNLPTSVDWEDLGHVSEVKNQGQCGSCWAFSTTGAIEAATSIAHGTTGGSISLLSEQQLVDCSTSFGNNGCDGGMMDFAFRYVEKVGGLCSEAEYPYEAKNGVCRSSRCKVHDPIKGYKDVQPHSETALMEALTHQPVSIGIEADQASFQFYGGGVMSGTCGSKVDHGVLVVGYGTTNDGQDFWKVKNSWGLTWGENGYIRFARNSTANDGAGQCGILSSPSYPLI